MMSHVKFENVSISYPVFSVRGASLKAEFFRRATGGRTRLNSNDVFVVDALREVSFEIRDGDAVGVVGHNGAGKTTLMRAMAGIYSPTSGVVNTSGTISSVIELGAGLEAELTGRENVRRLAYLMQYSRRDFEKVIDSIKEFSELGDYFEMPVRIYSSGMLLRLMFSVATARSPDILILDEMFSTGDDRFQKKAQARMERLIRDAHIFVFSSHSPYLINKFCNRVFVLNQGSLSEISMETFTSSYDEAIFVNPGASQGGVDTSIS
jgi:ABC-type polysaccharide/polyol phosphate transport system ATPase subunit